VYAIPDDAKAGSTARLAAVNGNWMSRFSRNDTKTNRSTAARLAASTSASWPRWSTVSIESPAWRDNVDDAVEITACTPVHARSSDASSLRSPRPAPRPPALFVAPARSLFEVRSTRQ